MIVLEDFLIICVAGMVFWGALWLGAALMQVQRISFLSLGRAALLGFFMLVVINTVGIVSFVFGLEAEDVAVGIILAEILSVCAVFVLAMRLMQTRFESCFCVFLFALPTTAMVLGVFATTGILGFDWDGVFEVLWPIM